MIELLKNLFDSLQGAPHDKQKKSLLPGNRYYAVDPKVSGYSINDNLLARPDVQQMAAYVRDYNHVDTEPRVTHGAFAPYFASGLAGERYKLRQTNFKEFVEKISDGHLRISTDQICVAYQWLYSALNNLDIVEVGLEYVKKLPSEQQEAFLKDLKEFYDKNVAILRTFQSEFRRHKAPMMIALNGVDTEMPTIFKSLVNNTEKQGQKVEAGLNLAFMKCGVLDTTFAIRLHSAADAYRQNYCNQCPVMILYLFYCPTLQTYNT